MTSTATETSAARVATDVNRILSNVVDVDRILSRGEVLELTSLSKQTIARLEARGDFPIRKQIAPNRIGWLLSEIVEWMKSKPGAA